MLILHKKSKYSFRGNLRRHREIERNLIGSGSGNRCSLGIIPGAEQLGMRRTKLSPHPGRRGSVVRAPAGALKGPGFVSQSRAPTWVVGSIPSPVWVCVGSNHSMCLSPMVVSPPPSLFHPPSLLPLSQKIHRKNILVLGLTKQHNTIQPPKIPLPSGPFILEELGADSTGALRKGRVAADSRCPAVTLSSPGHEREPGERVGGQAPCRASQGENTEHRKEQRGPGVAAAQRKGRLQECAG